MLNVFGGYTQRDDGLRQTSDIHGEMPRLAAGSRVEFAPQLSPVRQVGVHPPLKSRTVAMLPQVSQLVHQYVFQQPLIHQPELQVQPDAPCSRRA